MIFLLYDILLILATPLFVIYLALRAVYKKKGRAGIAERLGFLSQEKLRYLQGKKIIWVHAVSVGETMAAKLLIKRLRQEYPDFSIIVSTTTETGRSIAQNIPESDLHIFFPFDYPFAVWRILKAVSPALLVVVETEIWPNFLKKAAGLNIPVLLANGRISDRSFSRYLALQWFFRRILPYFSALCMQSDEDARRIIAMGAPSNRIHVTRNLKYDLAPVKVTESEKLKMREKFHIPAKATVISFASTHQGEEEIAFATYAGLRENHDNLYLVLVPRHPERGNAVEELVQRQGFKVIRRSNLPETRETTDVLIVDTVGELMQIYAASDIVFVGGSFVPVGGHNVLEPASLFLPVIFGPYMSNFREISTLIQQRGGGIQVADAAQLQAALENFITDPSKCGRVGANGGNFLLANVGATENHMKVIASLLPPQKGVT